MDGNYKKNRQSSRSAYPIFKIIDLSISGYLLQVDLAGRIFGIDLRLRQREIFRFPLRERYALVLSRMNHRLLGGIGVQDRRHDPRESHLPALQIKEPVSFHGKFKAPF